MLAGILTTALEIVIILDICGAIVYCLVYGLTRPGGDGGKRVRTGSRIPPLHPVYSSPFQPCPAEGIPAPSTPMPYPSTRSLAAIYAGVSAEAETTKSFNPIAGLKARIASLKHSVTNRLTSGSQTREMQETHQNLGRVLDSFKEEA